MQEFSNRKSNTSLAKKIAVLYVYLLPIRMIVQFSVLKSAMHGAGVYFDVILHAVGLIIYLINNKGVIPIGKDKNSKLMQYCGFMVLILNLSSVLMACVIQIKYGNIGSDTAFDGIIGMIIYFFQYFLMFWYNREVFKLITKEELSKIIHRMCIMLLVLGYWQFLIMNVGGVFSSVYDTLNIFGVLYGSNMPKLCLTGSEGASAGTLIAVFILPFLYSKILTEKIKKKYAAEVLLWLPVLYMTKSSTAYILFVVCTAVFVLLWAKQIHSKRALFGFAIASVLVFIIVAFPNEVLSLFPEKISEQISYLLLEKATDLNNGSTAARTVPLIVNWGAFSEYPIFGVGNGLQGYFYVKYFPSWAYDVAGSDVTVFLGYSKLGISNGGVFFPSILSGYGVLGVGLILYYIKKSYDLVKLGKEQLGSYYFYYIIASCAIIFSGFQGDFYGEYYLWFILSIPFMVRIDLPNNPLDVGRKKQYEK